MHYLLAWFLNGEHNAYPKSIDLMKEATGPLSLSLTLKNAEESDVELFFPNQLEVVAALRW